MQYVVTAKEMTQMDEQSINKFGIPGIILMENAGRGIAEMAKDMLKNSRGKNVHIYCGSGNNGGDGYVVARFLLNYGANVDIFILAPSEKIKGDALVNLNIVKNMGCIPHFIDRIPESNNKPDLIIDAILGTGVTGRLRGLFAEVVSYINTLKVPVLAIDIPTGVNADLGTVEGPAIKATKTATMALPKRGLLFSPGREYAGELNVIDISMPFVVCRELNPYVYRLEIDDISSMLPHRPLDTYKNRCGSVVVIAGSTGFTGAASLTSLACLKAGAGLCYLAIPKSLNVILETKLTEVITIPFDDANSGSLHSDCYDELDSIISDKDVLAIGPGIGQHDETAQLVYSLLKYQNKPVVLDADALNACVDHHDLIRDYQGEIILTPHPGELARLTHKSAQDINMNRIDIARHYAKEWNCILVLKGAPTVTALKNGQVFVNSTGNPGMATAGSGDVLTGIIAGLLAQGMSSSDAAIAGVFLHGFAGDYANRKINELSLLAGDIVQSISKSLNAIYGHLEE